MNFWNYIDNILRKWKVKVRLLTKHPGLIITYYADDDLIEFFTSNPEIWEIIEITENK